MTLEEFRAKVREIFEDYLVAEVHFYNGLPHHHEYEDKFREELAKLLQESDEDKS